MKSLVTSALTDTVLTLTLNRPDKMNALNLAMWRELADRVREIGQDSGVRCVIVQGAGAHFAVGADLAEFVDHRATADAAEAYGAVMLDALWGLRALPQPTIACIKGNCLGAGLELAAMCDIRIAAEDAKFGVPIQRVGVTMPFPELAALVDLLGRGVMLEILLAGRIHDAAWALSRGLVSHVLSDIDLAEGLRDLAARIVVGSPLSHRNHKNFTLRCLSGVPLTPEEVRTSYAAVESDDYREGIAAFLGKRRPVFTGN